MLFCRFIEESKETDDDEEYQFIKAGRKLFTYINTYSRKLITRLRQGLLLGRIKRIVPHEDKNQNIKIT